jgi:hypothetical protein
LTLFCATELLLGAAGDFLGVAGDFLRLALNIIDMLVLDALVQPIYILDRLHISACLVDQSVRYQ